MKFPWCFKKVSSVMQKSVWCVSRKFQGCVESISRVNQDSFEGVSGVFLRVFEESSKGVYSNFEGLSRGFQVSSWVFHGNLKNVSRVIQRSVMEMSSVSQKLQSVLRKFHGCFREISKVL